MEIGEPIKIITIDPVEIPIRVPNWPIAVPVELPEKVEVPQDA